MGLAWGHETGDNQGRGWIDAEMDLAVGASPLPVDSGEPGIGASDLKAGGINHNTAGAQRPLRQDQVTASAA